MEILGVAIGLFQQKGYERTSIQDIINAANISKGAFYHYFRSKEELVDELVDQMARNILVQFDAVVAESAMNAIEKFNQLIDISRNYKSGNRKLFQSLLHLFYDDENYLFRLKMRRRQLEIVAPYFERIIRQGLQEGVFQVDDPEECSQFLLAMGNSLQDLIAPIVLSLDRQPENLEEILKLLKIYEQASERLLAAPPQSIKVVDREFIKDILLHSE